jgi:hypothetical protein
MITLERLQVFDIEQTVVLASEFSDYYGVVGQPNLSKVRHLLENCVFNDNTFFCLVMKDENKVVGGLVGYIADHLLFDVSMAYELAWFVKEEYRGKHSIAMLKEFENWAKKSQGVEFVVMAYTSKMSNLDKVYKKLGYEAIEFTYKKNINGV